MEDWEGKHRSPMGMNMVEVGRGLGWIVAAFFIVADMVGGGVVAMPVAFLSTGLVLGVLFMSIICIFFAYAAHLLGMNWVIMQQRWPVYRRHCRKPYTEMARRSMGNAMKVFASVTVYVTLFGVAVVYILLSSKIFSHFLESFFDVHVSFCYLLCAVSLAIMPATYLKSPADFWLVVVIAMVCTVVAVLLIVAGITSDISLCYPEVRYPDVTPPNVLLSLGIFLFAFSGAHAFPTIQHDMRRPKDFSKSVVLGFALVAILYMPLSVYGYVVYGEKMSSSVIDSVQSAWIRQAADLAIGLHCILALLIMANPLNQQAEHFFNAPHSFGVERVLIRSGLMGTMLFSALTLPNFGNFMNLVGSTTIPTVCAILPCVFNLYLNAASRDEKSLEYVVPTVKQVIRRTSKVKLGINIVIILTSVIAGIVSAYLAIVDITHVNITYPCYVRPFLGLETIVTDSPIVQTCGRLNNISTLGRQLPIGR